ncbi:MAG TPA: CbiX/SirB N-terminal domain-containing protein [Polyangiaceae bacterium]|nr:CbiX/SirB N-terminal domain-containing protein [Polyangiaceae bacterium]
MSDDCVLLIGHGSREPGSNAEFEAIASAYRLARPELRVETAYIELAQPLIAEALAVLAAQVPRITVVPVFLFAAGHVKNDLPLAIAEARRAHPQCRISAAPALGVHPALAQLAFQRASVCLPSDPAARAKTLVLAVGRGSSDPDANGDFCKMCRLIGEGRGVMQVVPTFIGITQPRVEDSLELVARMRPERLVVLPYLLFAGRLIARLTTQIEAFRSRYPWIHTELASHLGIDDRLLALIDERVLQARSGTLNLACDSCQYRTDIAGLPSQVGGLRALLYSVRHTLTHSQATLPVHLHKPLKKHVLVCGNADCVERGSLGLLDALRREVKESGSAREIKVTRTACMGRCGEGPMVAVYPDGVWYRRVGERDAPELVTEHLIGDRLVGRLVDDILS